MPGYARPVEYFAQNVSFIPTSTISATNVQSAIVEVDEDIIYSSSAPENPSEGNLWVDSETFETYVFNGSEWVLIGGSGGGATGGGTDKVFYENDKTITTDYSITEEKNALSAGPITIDDEATVTIPDSSVWVIV